MHILTNATSHHPIRIQKVSKSYLNNKKKPYISTTMPTTGHPTSTTNMPPKKKEVPLTLCFWKKNLNVRSRPMTNVRPVINSIYKQQNIRRYYEAIYSHYAMSCPTHNTALDTYFSALMLLVGRQEGHLACKNFLLQNLLYQNQGEPPNPGFRGKWLLNHDLNQLIFVKRIKWFKSYIFRIFQFILCCKASLRATAYAVSVHMLSQLRLSVCPSVTRVDQSKTVEVRIMQFSPYSSPIPLVFAR